MCFLSADDMSAILAVKLRKRLGFGIWTKMHITGIHMEGKVHYIFLVKQKQLQVQFFMSIVLCIHAFKT